MKCSIAWRWSVIAAVTGCAQAPERPPAPHVFETARTPYSAAICIARNAKRLPGLTAEERLLGTSGWEVIVRTSGADGTLAAAEAHNRGTGSVVSLRIMSAPNRDPEAFARILTADCQARRVAP